MEVSLLKSFNRIPILFFCSHTTPRPPQQRKVRLYTVCQCFGYGYKTSIHSIEVNNLKNKNVIAGLINYYRQQQSCGKRKKQNVAKPRLPDETT